MIKKTSSILRTLKSIPAKTFISRNRFETPKSSYTRTSHTEYSFWLEDNKEHYRDHDNVTLCKLYDEFRHLIYPELCFDIYTPLTAGRPPEMLHKLSEIHEEAKAIIGVIESRGNAAMPVPFQWWLDLNARRMKERAWKVSLGKND